MYSESTSLLEIAQRYVRLGFSVFPCHTLENGCCSCGKADCDTIAKHPLTAHGVNDATTDDAKLQEYFTGKYASANIALATGETSGVWVLDSDDLGESIDALEAMNGKLPLTPISQTGGGGRHYFFKADERTAKLKNSVKFYGNLDVRANGGYVLLPPSLHASGRRYRWLCPPDVAPSASAPDWLLALIPKHGDDAKPTTTPAPDAAPIDSVDASVSRSETDANVDPNVVQKATTTLDRATAYLRSCPPAIAGERGHDTAYRIVCRLCEVFGALSDDDLFSVLETWNERCSPPWSSKELRHKIASARKKMTTQTPSPDDEKHDAGNGERGIDPDPADDWPTLDDDALHGLAGDIVRRILPHSECDALALLTTFLIAFGVSVGRRPYFVVEGSRHHANEFLAIVGSSAKARKGTSYGRIAELFDGTGLLATKVSGLSTGEGLIASVQDAEIVTVGVVEDKRRLVVESELAKVLQVMRRESNTLSAVLRDAWDTGDLRVVTRASPMTATDAHIAIVSHITADEFRKVASNGDVHNGFFNRFLFAMVRRSKLLPDGGGDFTLDDLRERLRTTIETSSKIERMERSPECRKLWCRVYAELVEEKSGSYDAATSRAEAHTLRLSILYALLDASPVIEVVHLQAALAVWRYCDDSARRIFGGVANEGNKLEKRFLSLIMSKPGIMRRELMRSVSHATKADDVAAALQRLIAQRTIRCVFVSADNGRQAETYYPFAEGLGTRDSFCDDDRCPCDSATTTTTATTTDENESLVPSPQVPTATLAELFDYRNAHRLDFVLLEGGGYGLSTANVPPEIAASVDAHQAILATLVRTPTPTIDDDDLEMSKEDFFAEINAATEADAPIRMPDACFDASGRMVMASSMTLEAFSAALDDDRRHGYTDAALRS